MKRLLTKKEVRHRVCYGFAHIDRLESQGRFPKRVRLGPNRVGWLESEIDEWIDERVRKRDSSPH